MKFAKNSCTILQKKRKINFKSKESQTFRVGFQNIRKMGHLVKTSSQIS